MRALTLIALCFSSPIVMAGSYCDSFSELAEHTMSLRQEGEKIQHNPTNQIEHEMIVNAWHWAGYRSEDRRNYQVREFTSDWSRACHAGWYNTN